jgi:hypothetical protein
MNPIHRWIKARLRPGRERRQRAGAEVVIVSFPKSGRTWFRLMLGKALCDRYDLPEDKMIDTLWLTRAAGLPPAVLTHDGGSNLEARHVDRLVRHKDDYRDKKVLLLARDPRDVVTSCYFQASRRRKLFRGSISDFVRDPHYGIRKIVTWLNIWHENRDVPRGFQLIRYEDLKGEPVKTLRVALELMGVSDLDDGAVAAAVEFARFENMKKMEQEKRFDSGIMRTKGADPESSKVRKGKVGGHKEYLAPDDIEYCNQVIEELGCPLLPAR